MWNLSPDDRLDHWRDFRRELDTLSTEQALQQCSHLWSYAPFVQRYLTPERVNSWPNPWELLAENRYCDLAKALGIVYTLHLSDHGSTLDLGILVCQDPESRGQYNLAWINEGKYVLNLSHDEVVNTQHVQPHLALEFKYTSQDLGMNKYK
jgi:hypothetical protein